MAAFVVLFILLSLALSRLPLDPLAAQEAAGTVAALGAIMLVTLLWRGGINRLGNTTDV